jgi:hypothetical protein
MKDRGKVIPFPAPWTDQENETDYKQNDEQNQDEQGLYRVTSEQPERRCYLCKGILLKADLAWDMGEFGMVHAFHNQPFQELIELYTQDPQAFLYMKSLPPIPTGRA